MGGVAKNRDRRAFPKPFPGAAGAGEADYRVSILSTDGRLVLYLFPRLTL
jgi:hypothetical protein